MTYRISLRIDAKTGQIGEFLVETVGGAPMDLEHDDDHDDFARLIADQLDPRATVQEVSRPSVPEDLRPGLRSGLEEEPGVGETEGGQSV
jgi:hypothetical protein